MNAAGLQPGEASGRSGPAHAPGGKTRQGPSPGGGARGWAGGDLEAHGRRRKKRRAGTRRRTQQDRPRARRARSRGKAAHDSFCVGIGKACGLANDGREGAGADRLLKREKNIGPAGHAHQHEIAPRDAVKGEARRMGDARFEQRKLLRDPQDRSALPFSQTLSGHQREARGGGAVRHRGGRDLEEGGAAAGARGRDRFRILQSFVFQRASARLDARDRFPQNAYPFRSAAWRHRFAPFIVHYLFY